MYLCAYLSTMNQLLLKLTRDPLGFVRRLIEKWLTEPRRYGQPGGDYDAARYWHDRLARHGDTLRGVGDEGLPEADNAAQYALAAQHFDTLCQGLPVEFTQARVLEIGVGTGFYTTRLQAQGVQHYLGVDITDTNFPRLQERFPAFRFVRKDITADEVEGEYDLIVMIDVIEHIVTDEKVARTLATLDRALRPGGYWIIAPLAAEPQKHLFYVRFWALDEVQRRLPTYTWSAPRPFRSGALYAAQKPVTR